MVGGATGAVAEAARAGGDGAALAGLAPDADRVAREVAQGVARAASGATTRQLAPAAQQLAAANVPGAWYAAAVAQAARERKHAVSALDAAQLAAALARSGAERDTALELADVATSRAATRGAAIECARVAERLAFFAPHAVYRLAGEVTDPPDLLELPAALGRFRSAARAAPCSEPAVSALEARLVVGVLAGESAIGIDTLDTLAERCEEWGVADALAGAVRARVALDLGGGPDDAKRLARMAMRLAWAGFVGADDVAALAARAEPRLGEVSPPTLLGDVALQFSLAGHEGESLFAGCATLAADAAHALGGRARLRRSNARALSAKLAAAGVRDEGAFLRLQSAAGPGEPAAPLCDDALFLLWKASKRLPKRPAPVRFAGLPRFADETLPLAVDVGCGFGSCALGHAAAGHEMNWLGIDAQPAAVARAEAIARRWGVEARARFVAASALDALEACASYPGGVRLVAIQFPTPDADAKGGAAIHNKGEWMASDAVCALAEDVLSPGGAVLVNSQVEDVVVRLHANLAAIPGLEPAGGTTAAAEPAGALLARDSAWAGARAVGPGFVTESPLLAVTETEAACRLTGRVVHRAMFVKSSPPNTSS